MIFISEIRQEIPDMSCSFKSSLEEMMSLPTYLPTIVHLTRPRGQLVNQLLYRDSMRCLDGGVL